MWDTETGQLTLTLTGHSSLVSSVGFSPDGRRIVSGSGDGTVKLWDVETGRETLTLEAHRSVSSVSFSPDGQQLISVDPGHASVRVWDARPKIEVQRSAH